MSRSVRTLSVGVAVAAAVAVGLPALAALSPVAIGPSATTFLARHYYHSDDDSDSHNTVEHSRIDHNTVDRHEDSGLIVLDLL